MRIKSIFLLGLVTLLSACSNNVKIYNEYKYRHQQGLADYDDKMRYGDELFDEKSTIYNPSLASASISFAMASFASNEKPTEYSDKYKNVQKLLSDLQFVDFDVNEDYKKKPGKDTIGLVAARKKVDDYTLIAVGVRGAAYESEWASNVTLGNREDGYHDGFRTAADNYISWLKTYIEKYDISGNVKLWACGYSRAGATTNIAIGLIDENLKNNQHFFGEKVKINKENIYCYCFEPSMGAPIIKDESGNLTVKSSDYNNIFNIVNFNDPIPLVAMHELGFTRYGIDYYLPDPMLTLDYKDHFSTLNSIYDQMSNHNAIGSYRIFDFDYKGGSGFSTKANVNSHHMSQGLFLRELISAVAVAGLDEDLDYYVNSVQLGLRNIFALLYSSGAFKGSLIDLGVSLINDLGIVDEVDILVSDLTIEGVDAFINDLKPLLTRALFKLGLEVDVTETMNDITELIRVFGKALYRAFLNAQTYIVFSLINMDNVMAVASGHYPELCEAHVKALDPQYDSSPYNGPMDGQYYKLFIEDTKTSIEIFNNDHKIVNINNDGEIDNRISYIKRIDGYEIYLPGHEEYVIELGNSADIYLEKFDSKIDEMVETSITKNSDTLYLIYK